MQAIRIAAIARPSTYPLLFDSSFFSTFYLSNLYPGYSDPRYRVGGTSFSGEGIIRPGGGAWMYQASGVWLAHKGKANGIFADFHVEACDGNALKYLSTPNRFTTTKVGIVQWKDQQGREVAATFP